MTLQELKNQIRIQLDDKESSLYSDEQLRVLINSAYRHIWNKLLAANIFLKMSSVDVNFTTVQEVEITGSADIQKIIHIQHEDGRYINLVSEAQAKRSDSPVCYLSRQVTTVGSESGPVRIEYLGWYRVPSNAFTLTLSVCSKVSQFISTDSSSSIIHDIPPEHHDLITTWATILALGGLEEASEFWINLYQEQLANVLSSNYKNDEADAVVDYDTYG